MRRQQPNLLQPLRACVALTKVRLSAMVAGSAAAGAGAAGTGDPALLAGVAAGTLLASMGANAANQVAEAGPDRAMKRTEERPVAAGELSPAAGLAAAAFFLGTGAAILAAAARPLAALLALGTALLYVAVYTPLKRRSTLNTVVGAVCGATPPLIGWVAVQGNLAGGGWFLAALLFAWQFPHFLAVAWLHRKDYARAGFRMLPVEDRDGGLTFEVMVLYALVLLLLGPAAASARVAGWTFAGGALAASAVFLGLCAQAARRRDEPTVRRVFRASLVYLPILLLLFALDRPGDLGSAAPPSHQVALRLEP